MGASILTFTTKSPAKSRPSREVQAAAFSWALSEQRRNHMFAQQMVLNINDEDGVDCGDAIVSLFVHPDTSEALLVRVWPEKLIARFDRIENYEELTQNAPKVLEQLQHNALESYRHRDLATKGPL